MNQKIILIAGTKPKSIGRFVGQELHKLGWQVWIYSRHAKKIDQPGWHERACDVSKEAQVTRLLSEIPHLDATILAADSDGHGTLAAISEKQIKNFTNAKLVGSVLLVKHLKQKQPKKPTKLIWLMGKLGVTNSELFAYGLVNCAISQLTEQINATEKFLKAYAFSLGVISPSELGDKYISRHKGKRIVSDAPLSIVLIIKKILMGELKAGILLSDQSKMN